MKYIVLFHLTGKRNQREFMYCGQSHIARKIVELEVLTFLVEFKTPSPCTEEVRAHLWGSLDILIMEMRRLL